MSKKLIHAGGPLNARVYRVRDADGSEFVEKDFSASPWIVRHTLGRFLIWRECWILRRLAGTGVVPGGVRRISPFVLREAFCEGRTLREVRDDVRDGRTKSVPRSFFESLEAGLRACHAAGFVHLDLHNYRNVIVGADWKPVLLDWQSALPTFLLPGVLRRALERIDWAGVCKFRNKLRPGDLKPDERRFLERSRFIRSHFWFPRLHRTSNGKGRPPA